MVGKTISHYKILEKIGEGGMGVVYKAEDTKLHRAVALKFIRPDAVDNRELKARFLTEAEAAAALDHSNICTIHEIDESDGRTFLVMAYVEGESLSGKIRQRPLPLDEALDIAAQVGEGLQAAHEKGIVHRDIKPSNIMVDPKNRVKVMDFGLAHLEEATRITKTDAVLGTPAYMSPEQVKGETADQRADIWSLGVVLYEMVTGRLPFKGEVAEAVSHSILYETPEPLTALRSGIPVELDRIVSKALVKAPGERYQHTDEILVDLRALLKQLSTVESKPPTRGATKRPRPRAVAYSAAALFAAVLLASIGLYLTGFWKTRPPDEVAIAVLPLENLSEDPGQDYFSDGMTAALITDLGSIGDFKVISRTSVMRFKGTSRPLSEVARELNVTHLVEGSVLRAGDQVRITTSLVDAGRDQQIWSKRYQRALVNVLSLQNDVARAIAGEIQAALTLTAQHRLASSRAVNPEAYDAYLKGLYHWSGFDPKGWDIAIQSFNESILADPTFAPPHAGLGEIYAFLGWANIIPYREAFPKANAAVRKALELDDNLAEAHAVLGFIKSLEWDWSEADREFQRALELNPNAVKAHLWRGQYLRDTMQLEESFIHMRRAEQLDPLTPFVLSVAGWPLFNARRYDEAIKRYRKVLELDPQFQLAIYNLGLAYLGKGMWQEAIRAFKEASRLGDERWTNGRISLAYTYAVSGRREEAISTLKALLEQSEDGAGSLPNAFAVVYLGLGDEERSLQYLERALEERSPSLATQTSERWLDPLREHPRFRAIREKMGLP